MDRFQAMTAYRAVVEEEGFGRAARRLGVSTAAVSRTVAELERALHTRLLHRTTRALSPTEEGHVYYHRCVAILDQVAETELALREARGIATGTLRVTVAPALGLRVIAPLIADYHQAHPNVRVELMIDDRVVDLVREGYDLALRLWTGPMPSSSLVARPLTTFYELLVATPRHLAEHGVPAHPTDLVRAAVLCMASRTGPQTIELTGPDGVHTVRVSGPVGSDSSLVLRRAALDHLGIALVAEYTVRPDLLAGDLVEVLPAYRTRPLRFYAVFPPAATLAARVRTFVDHLTEHIRGWSPEQTADGS